MTAFLTSVQTADDTTLPPWPVSLLIVAAALILTGSLFAPHLRDAWQRARRATSQRQDAP